jgi:predicted nucleic acid-binding protein
MMKTYILDTNITLRFLLADEPNQSPKAKELFSLAESGQITLRLTHVLKGRGIMPSSALLSVP